MSGLGLLFELRTRLWDLFAEESDEESKIKLLLAIDAVSRAVDEWTGREVVVPYKSEAQRKKFHAMVAAGKMDPKVVAEFDKASVGLKLPARVKAPVKKK